MPFYRSAEKADDHAPTIEVIKEVLGEYKKLGEEFDYACCIYPTAPFITADKLKNAFDTLKSSGKDALVPVVKFSFPPQRCFVIDGESLKYKWPENEFARSQDLEPFYHDAGQFYFQKTKTLLEGHSLVPTNTAPFIVDDMEVQDIDTIDDWNIAEIKYRKMIETS